MLLTGVLILFINLVLIYGACPPIVDETVAAKCKLRDAIVDCSLPVQEGTQAQISCAVGYEAPDGAPSTMLCEKDVWDVPLKKCVPVAHCFTDNEGKVIDFSEVSVTAGKSRTDFDDARDSHAQVASIEKVIIPDSYKDILTAYRDDIAVLVLKKPFSLNSHVLPVCVDWANQNENEQLQQDAFGIITGSVGPGRTKIPELSKEHMIFLESSECYKVIPRNYYEYFTHDKFCAVSKPGTAATCTMLSGSALAFKGNATQKYFIRGIASSAPKQTADTCIHLPVLFTRISSFLPWIAKAVAQNK